MNFQSVSTAEKLPTSPLSGLTANGGYVRQHGTWVPGLCYRMRSGSSTRRSGG